MENVYIPNNVYAEAEIVFDKNYDKKIQRT